MKLQLRRTAPAPRRTVQYALVAAMVVVGLCFALFQTTDESSGQVRSPALLTDESSGQVRSPALLNTVNDSNKQFKGKTYVPAPLEAYMMGHAVEYGWNDTRNMRPTCPIWSDPKATGMYPELQMYVKELDEYNRLIKEHPRVPDIRLLLDKATGAQGREAVCAQVELHPQGLRGIFKSGQLSHTQSSGYVEPLLPPLRHPKFCINATMEGGLLMNNNYLFELDYLVHDFAATCRQHKVTSRNIFIDMGAKLDFAQKDPKIYHTDVFAQFGLPFDHIYAFESSTVAAPEVYNGMSKYMHAYHWINIPVSADPGSSQNPLKLLLDNYNENDFVVVKLDIDSPALEMSFIDLILDDVRYQRLIDHFYFEYHVKLAELARNWGPGDISVLEALELFNKLREKGVPSHFWP